MPKTNVSILGDLVRRVKSKEQDPLRPLIDRYFIERDKSENRLLSYTFPFVERDRFHGRIAPSNVCGCERKAVFSFMGIHGQKRVDPDTQAIFDDGNWRHHKWQATFRDMEKVLGRKVFQVLGVELRVRYRDLYIGGSLDALVRIYGVLYVIDFKGCNEWAYKKLTERDDAVEMHQKQVSAYCQAVATYKNLPEVPRGIILYENKNNQQLRSFFVNPTSEHWTDIEVWSKRVLRAMRERELPDRHIECQQGNFTYERCPYSTLCYGAERDTIDERAFKGFQGVKATWRAGIEAERKSKEHALSAARP